MPENLKGHRKNKKKKAQKKTTKKSPTACDSTVASEASLRENFLFSFLVGGAAAAADALAYASRRHPAAAEPHSHA